jgi:phosphoserine phosphatase RsbU/P
LKLQSVTLDSPALGTCFAQQMPLHLHTLGSGANLPAGFSPEQAAIPLMVAPLNYGSKKLGVIVAANIPVMGPFPAHLFELFCSVAEQSAFALGTAMLQEEALEKRRLEGELRAASEVQRVLLPSTSPALNHYTIAATNVAARIVSGDYYDFIPVDSGHTGVVIADVSGKGIPASLVMTTCRGLLRGLAGAESSPSKALSKVNRMIYEDVKQDMFISLAYVMLDESTHDVALSRAGHDAPFLYKSASREILRLEPPGVALGVDDGDVFDRVTRDYLFTMEPGDCLLLYTDGVNEAEDLEGDQFGLDRLEQAFRVAAPSGAEAVLSHVQAELRLHVQGSVQSDDITLIAIQRK